MARPKNQAQRRADLIAVASRLLVEHGAAGARLTDIAAAAGLTPASVSYYYPNLVDLYAETTQIAAAEYVAERRERVDMRVGAIERLRECLRLGIPIRGKASFDSTVLLLELGALSSRNRELDDSANRFMQAQADLFEEIIVEGIEAAVFAPQPSAATAARILLAVEDGLCLSVIRGAMHPDDALGTILAAARAVLKADI